MEYPLRNFYQILRILNTHSIHKTINLTMSVSFNNVMRMVLITIIMYALND